MTPSLRLGRSGLLVSPLCLGTMTFGARTDERDAAIIYARAREAGINFIDTADTYNSGKSEEIVGRLVASERDEIVLATKASNPFGNNPNHRGLSRAWLMTEVPRSLKRLGTDRIDVLYLHKEDPLTPLEETVRALEDLVRGGLIRYIGVSNHKAWRVAEIVRYCDQANITRPVVCQPYYHALNRTIEVELLPACAAYDIAVFPYSPLARGVLSGKYSGSSVPADSRAAVSDKRILETDFQPESLAAAEKIVAHAKARGVNPSAFAIAFVLANPMVTGAIAGPRTLEQLEAYLEAVDVVWTAEDEAAVEAVVPAGAHAIPHYVDPQYPVEGRPFA
ncbi:aldo/keto reductase [Acuticoccus kandeliae]|uniref:aldo/keto reductase n=1 Tax=Acuticoccus kandeliae TaxID=2073160 RepID=UPI000D3E3C5F|nr:aldo/keto reductase [Acuticoccus kandeliae]